MDFHHIHVWAISTSENALTAHLVVDKTAGMELIEKLKHRIKHDLLHRNIQHAHPRSRIVRFTLRRTRLLAASSPVLPAHAE